MIDPVSIATAAYKASPLYPVKLFRRWSKTHEMSDLPGYWYEALFYTATNFPDKVVEPGYHKIIAYRRLCQVLRDEAQSVGRYLPTDWAYMDATKTKKWTNLAAAWSIENDIENEWREDDAELPLYLYEKDDL